MKKSELVWLCRYFCLPIWSDHTNYNYSIQRNRIRNELIPYLKKYLSNNIEYKLTSFLKLTNLDNEYSKQNTIKLYLISKHKFYIALNYIFIKKQHKAIQTRILQLFFFHNFKITLNNQIMYNIIYLMNINIVYHHIIKYYKLHIYITASWIYII